MAIAVQRATAKPVTPPEDGCRGNMFAGGVANGRPTARNGRAPLGDGWSEHGGAVRRDRTRV